MQLRNHNGKYATTILSLALGVFLLSLQAFAANHYVRAAASGTGSGADWTNACTDFTGSCAVASLVRGDTYYVGTGTYAGRTFSTATSASLVITIKGATVADHGTSTGWSNTFSVSNADGGAQATFSSTITFSTSNWVFDGMVPNTLWDQTCADYGFAFAANTINVIFGTGVGSTFTNFTVNHTCGDAVSTDTQKEKFQTCLQCGAVSNVTIGHNLGTGWQGWLFLKSNGIGATDSNWVFEYNTALEQFSSTTNHAELIDPDSAASSGMIVRYNLVYGYVGPGGQFNNNCASNGGTGIIVANNSANSGSQIYGNVFDTICVGAVVIGGTSAGTMSNANIYNNVFANYQSGSSSVFCSDTRCSGLLAQNNIFYNYSNCNGAGSPNCIVGGAGVTTDYNAYYSSNGTPSETNGQTASGNPFVNSAAFNYNLVANTNAGNSLSSSLPTGCTVGVNCYDIDALGVTRGANGTWDRGALQLAGSIVIAPTFSPVAGTYPTSQTVAISTVTTGATICYTTDGTLPTANGAGTCTHGTTLTNGTTISVASSVTVQALGSLSGDTDSSVASATYTIGTPIASLTPASLSFGGINISNSSPTQTLTLQNTGTAAMSITSISLIGANSGDFFQSNNCPVGSNLGNGASCTITATFTPLAVGSRAASVSVVDGATGSPHTSTLSGTGVQANIASQMNPGVRMSGRAIVK